MVGGLPYAVGGSTSRSRRVTGTFAARSAASIVALDSVVDVALAAGRLEGVGDGRRPGGVLAVQAQPVAQALDGSARVERRPAAGDVEVVAVAREARGRTRSARCPPARCWSRSSAGCPAAPRTSPPPPPPPPAGGGVCRGPLGRLGDRGAGPESERLTSGGSSPPETWSSTHVSNPLRSAWRCAHSRAVLRRCVLRARGLLEALDLRWRPGERGRDLVRSSSWVDAVLRNTSEKWPSKSVNPVVRQVERVPCWSDSRPASARNAGLHRRWKPRSRTRRPACPSARRCWRCSH